MFEDPRPGAASILLATGANIDEVLSSIQCEPYCNACSKEANRLNRQTHQIAVMLSNFAQGALSEFGQQRRRDR
jgi:hypothetical protein